MLLCLSVTMLGADSFVDSTTDIVCVMDYDYATSVDFVDSTVPAPSDVVFVATEATPTIDIHATATNTAESYGKAVGSKNKYNRSKSKTKRKRNRSSNKQAFPGQSRSAKPARKCAAYN